MSRPRSRSAAASALVPAAARAGALESSETALNEEAIELFATAVGGRQALADVLSIGGGSRDVERITTLLLDPRYAGYSLPRLCTLVGISVAELFVIYRKAAVARAHIQATHVIAAKLVPVVEDVMARATPQRQVCPKCLGTSAAGAGPCLLCQDTGVIQSTPDLDRQKLALELGQLIEKKGGLLIQQNNVAAAVSGTAPGSLEQLQQAVGDLLFGGPDRRAAAAAEVALDPTASEVPEAVDADVVEAGV